MVAERRWLSCRETGEVYGLHVKTVLALCRRGAIPHVRLPSIRGGRGQIRVDRSAFDALLERGSIQPAESPLDRRRRS